MSNYNFLTSVPGRVGEKRAYFTATCQQTRTFFFFQEIKNKQQQAKMLSKKFLLTVLALSTVLASPARDGESGFKMDVPAEKSGLKLTLPAGGESDEKEPAAPAISDSKLKSLFGMGKSTSARSTAETEAMSDMSDAIESAQKMAVQACTLKVGWAAINMGTLCDSVSEDTGSIIVGAILFALIYIVVVAGCTTIGALAGTIGSSCVAAKRDNHVRRAVNLGAKAGMVTAGIVSTLAKFHA
jgi:hypothetical protein